MPVIDAVFVIVLVLAVCSTIGAFVFARHRERMAMIEKGIKADDLRPFLEKSARAGSVLTSLKWGIVLVSVGVAIVLSLWLQEAYGVRGGVYPAMIALFGGAGLVVFYIVARKKAKE
jgi:hypothetical protein